MGTYEASMSAETGRLFHGFDGDVSIPQNHVVAVKTLKVAGDKSQSVKVQLALL